MKHCTENEKSNVRILPLETFDYFLDELEKNALSNARSYLRSSSETKVLPFILPKSLHSNYMNSETPDEVKAIFEVEEATVNLTNADQKLSMESSVDTFKNNKDFDAFEESLDDADTKAIEKFAYNRAQSTKRLKEAGRKYPSARHAIVKSRSTVDMGLDVVRGLVGGFANDLIDNIGTMANQAITRISETFTKVAGNIKNIFGGLFSNSPRSSINHFVTVQIMSTGSMALNGLGFKNQELPHGTHHQIQLEAPSNAESMLTVGDNDSGIVFMAKVQIRNNLKSILISQDYGIEFHYT